jgi:hypothetical protein
VLYSRATPATRQREIFSCFTSPRQIFTSLRNIQVLRGPLASTRCHYILHSRISVVFTRYTCYTKTRNIQDLRGPYRGATTIYLGTSSTHQQKYLLHPGIWCVATIFTRDTCYVKTPNIQALREPLATAPADRPNIQDVHKHHQRCNNINAQHLLRDNAKYSDATRTVACSW